MGYQSYPPPLDPEDDDLDDLYRPSSGGDVQPTLSYTPLEMAQEALATPGALEKGLPPAVTNLASQVGGIADVLPQMQGMIVSNAAGIGGLKKDTQLQIGVMGGQLSYL